MQLSFWWVCELWGLLSQRKTMDGSWYSLGVIWAHNRTNLWSAWRPLRSTWLWYLSSLRKASRCPSLTPSQMCPRVPRYLHHTDCNCHVACWAGWLGLGDLRNFRSPSSLLLQPDDTGQEPDPVRRKPEEKAPWPRANRGSSQSR